MFVYCFDAHRAIEKLICYRREGDEASKSCTAQENSIYETIIFGGVQIMLSQIPDMHNMGWLSIFATIMSFSYSTIAIALGLFQVLGTLSVLSITPFFSFCLFA